MLFLKTINTNVLLHDDTLVVTFALAVRDVKRIVHTKKMNVFHALMSIQLNLSCRAAANDSF